MFEEFLSDLGKAFAPGLVTAAAFVAMRGLAIRPVHQYLRAPWRKPWGAARIIETPG